MNIYVGNLDFRVQETELKQAFEAYGEIESIQIITDKYSGRSKGFAFVNMLNQAEGQKAIDELNGTEIGNREVTVNEARPKKEY